MSESPEELIAEWLCFEKEYAGLENRVQAILEVSAIKDRSEIDMRTWTAMYEKDGILSPRAASPPSQLVAYHEFWKVCAKQFDVAERMKKIRTMAVVRTSRTKQKRQLSPVSRFCCARFCA